ncbi:hypothetical protein [Sphingomonas sp.]|uniref:hypothetical protein n=1 Tax=Sphingomonas sp. TaxID=28214 RepID=UPI003B00ADCB
MILFALSLFVPAIALQVSSHHRGDQWRVFEQRREGRILPLREIEGRVVPTMRGADYLGFEFDGASAVYTLKFLRDGAVIWVEVDGRSGQIIGRTGR